MPVDRVSALDASFLAAESPTAHTHVGWARASVDDPGFDRDRHVFDAGSSELTEGVDQAMSTPIGRSRPLWEPWIAPRLCDGRVGVVGKAHDCMVDGLAAVESAALPRDPSEPPERIEPAVATAHAFATRAPVTVFNASISALRHLAMVSRPLAELRRIKQLYGTTVNQVVLGLYADRRSLPDVDMPAREDDREIDQLLVRASAERRPGTALRSRQPLAPAP